MRRQVDPTQGFHPVDFDAGENRRPESRSNRRLPQLLQETALSVICQTLGYPIRGGKAAVTLKGRLVLGTLGIVGQSAFSQTQATLQTWLSGYRIQANPVLCEG